MKKSSLAVLLFVLILLSLKGSGAQDASLQAVGDPELPRVFLDTTYTPPTGNTINVPAGGDLQAAINAASPGDTIVLQAGATYTTPSDGFILPNKGGSSWIVIRTSNIQALPEGTRVGPSNAPAMAKIVTTGVWPAIQTAPASHHYRLIGIEFALDPNLRNSYGIIALGDGSRGQNNLDLVPHDIIIDRCYIHGTRDANLTRGIALNSARTSVIDSYISDCHGIGFDTQALAVWNNPGPIKIVNNYLEGAAENVLFGGADPAIQGLVPSDIEFRRNHCFKPLSWKADDPSYAGSPWSIKNIFELKNAQRILIDGNTFENNWVSGQSGPAIVLTVRNQEGTAPWSVVQDITFTNNVLKHSAAGILITATDSNGVSQQTKRVRIANNLFDDIGGARWGGGGRWLQILDGVANVSVDHNTVLHTSHIVMGEGRANTSFIYRNNLSRHNEYGIVGTGTSSGNNTLNTYFPGAIFLKNVLAGGPAQAYPAGNFFPATLDQVGFVNAAAGNYRLASNSPYKGAGTDGKDIGADFDALEAAMGGGSSTPPPPPPPPPSQTGDVVLYAAEAPVKAGAWTVVADSSAAGGSRLHNPDFGAPKLPTPLANPASYFEMAFNAEAGRPYHLWIRARAQNDFYGNDSIFIQFSGSVNQSGSAVYRIGTGSAADINLEDCSGCGLSGWGWQDNGWGVGVMGPAIYFQTSGLQTIRIQPREDGLSIDQIVLSPGAYLSASPGALKNDNTILPKSGGGTPPPVNLPPLVSLTASPTSGVSPLSVQFTGIASDADGTIAAYRWDFGDNQTSSAQSPAHTYQSAGSYTARFTATDNSGASSSASVVITVTSPPQSSSEIVKYAAEAAVKVGGWTVVADSSAAGGSRIHLPDAGAPKLSAPLASPAKYFEMTFNAQAGTPYRLWIRGKALSDFYGNDSIWAQFSGSVTSTGAAIYRIGTTSGADINLEDCSGCGLQGWGWQDNGWGVGVMGPVIYFATTGQQTIRIQNREDGLSIDQIVLSPSTYLNTSPGALKNDSVILPKQ